MAQAVMTEIGRKKLCKAHAGDMALSKIVKMALGDGGLDGDGKPKKIFGQEVSLYNELLVKDIGEHVYMNTEETTCRYTMDIEKTELVDTVISEMGLYDIEGDLIAYKTFLGKGKDEDMEFTFNMDEIF